MNIFAVTAFGGGRITVWGNISITHYPQNVGAERMKWPENSPDSTQTLEHLWDPGYKMKLEREMNMLSNDTRFNANDNVWSTKHKLSDKIVIK